MKLARPPHLLTIRQAAKNLGVRRITLRQMIALGQLPVWRNGDRVYVDPMSARAALDRARGSWWFSAKE